MSTRRITRDELHQLVWSMPMPDVANHLGITRGELDRLCDSLDVPFPFSGYWRGQERTSAITRKLRTAKPGTPNEAEITETVPLVKTKRAVSQRGAPEEEIRSPPAEEERLKGIRLSSKPHRITAARLAETRRQEASWRAAGLSVNAREDQVVRRRRIIEDRLFKAVEGAGHKLELERESLHLVRLVVKGQHITHTIRERYTQKRRPLTDEELQHSWNAGRTHTQERVMTGELVLSMDAPRVGRAECRDEPGRPLELQMDEIVSGLEGLAERAAKAEAEHRERERQWALERSRQHEIRMKQKTDANQWRRLRELSARAEEAQRVRALLDRLCSAAGEPSDDTRQWLDWAEEWLQAWDPAALGLGSVIADVRSVTAHAYADERN